MKYGIVEGNKFLIIDGNKQRLIDTLAFIPSLSEKEIIEYNDDEVAQGYDGSWYMSGSEPKISFEEAKALKLSEINTACDSILNAAISTYPETEVLTFDQQISEANAYLASQNPSDAPLLTALAAGRGITLDDLVQRVIAKHDAFSQLSGYVIGQRQALEDKLDLCQTVEDVESVSVNISLPETGND